MDELESRIERYLKEKKIPRKIIIKDSNGKIEEEFFLRFGKNDKEFLYSEVELIPKFGTVDGFELDWDEMLAYLEGVEDRGDGSSYEFVF